MRLLPGVLSSLVILAALPRVSLGDDALPSPSYLADLQQRYMAVAAREPDLVELLNASVKRSGLQTPQDLIGQVRFCDDGASHMAGVKQSRETRMYLIARELDEPALSESALKAHYLESNKDIVAPDAKVDAYKWEMGPDIITLYQVSDKRQICIKSGVSSLESVDLLAHELVHYAHIPDTDQVRDVLEYSDAEDFASRIISQPGEELEAYKVQFGLAIRLRGKDTLAAPRYVLQSFSDQGQFTGQDWDLKRYILDDLQYRQKRFKPEYESALKMSLSHDEQVLGLEKQLLELRSKQEGELSAAIAERYRILDFFWSKYRATSENYKKLLGLATESKARLVKDGQDLTARCEELRKRIAALH